MHMSFLFQHISVMVLLCSAVLLQQSLPTADCTVGVSYLRLHFFTNCTFTVDYPPNALRFHAVCARMHPCARDLILKVC